MSLMRGEFHSMLYSDDSIYLVANKNIWKYNILSRVKNKITTIASHNITINSLK